MARWARASLHVERWLLVWSLAGLLILCWICFPQFRTGTIFVTMVNAQSLVLLLALTATLTLRVGDFDLSIPQTMVVCAAVVASLAKMGVALPLACLAGIALGALIGFANALLVVRVGIDSFVCTLGSFTALSGLAYFVTNGRVMTGVSPLLVASARERVLGIPMITWYSWVFVAILWYVYERTPLGRYMVFIGGSRSAAFLAGIPVARIREGGYVISGLLASLIGIVSAGYFGAVDPSLGSQFMLQPFAAAFLGATAVTVGRFNAFGTVAALYLLTVGITGLQLLGAQTWISNVFYGTALIAAVAVAKVAGKRRSAGRAG